MARMKYLHPYKGVYHVRMIIPARLRPLFLDKKGEPKSNLTETTGERDPKMAEIKALPIIAKFKQLLAQAERGELFWLNPARNMNAYMMQFVRPLIANGTTYTPDGFMDTARRGQSREVPFFDDAVEFRERLTTFCEAHGIRGKDREAFQQYVLSEARNFFPAQHPVHIVPAPEVIPPATASQNTLSVFRNGYLEARGFDAKRKLEITRAFRFLERITGDVDMNTITPRHILETVKLMERSPVGLKLSQAADQMTPAEVMTTSWPVTMHSETVKKNLSFIRSAFDYAVHDLLIPSNPALGVKVLAKLATVREVDVRPFKPDELKTLMLSPLFASCAGDGGVGELAKPGNVKVRDHRFWMPWVALYTAARQEEVAQLERSDLRQDDGVWYLHIRGSKTERSVRDVPVHDHLIQLGFIEYAQKQTGRLFPVKETSKELAKSYSATFGRYMDKIGLSDPELRFHSLRHTWIGEAKHTDIPRDAWQQMSAHQDEKNVGDDYARDERRRMSKLKEYMDRIRFEGITPAPKRAKPKSEAKTKKRR
jgi:integrase